MKKYYTLLLALTFGFTQGFSRPNFFKNDIYDKDFTLFLEKKSENIKTLEESINLLNEELKNLNNKFQKGKNLEGRKNLLTKQIKELQLTKDALDGQKNLLKTIKNAIDSLYSFIDRVSAPGNSSNTKIIGGIFQQFLNTSSKNSTLKNNQDMENFLMKIKTISDIQEKIKKTKESNALTSILNNYFNINSLFSFVKDCETFMIENKILEKGQNLQDLNVDSNFLKQKLNFYEEKLKLQQKKDQELDLQYDIIEKNEASQAKRPKPQSWGKWILSGLSKIKPW